MPLKLRENKIKLKRLRIETKFYEVQANSLSSVVNQVKNRCLKLSKVLKFWFKLKTKSVLIEFRPLKQRKLSILLFYFLLPSCFLFQKPPVQVIEEASRDCSIGNADFSAGQVSNPPNTNAIIFQYKESLKESFSLNLRTCLTERLRPDVSIPGGSRFEIFYESNLTGKEEQIEVVSDSGGCIQWEETYKYKYTLSSSWIGLKRVIRQVGGVYRGTVEIEMAVNPWLSDNEKEEKESPEILDRRCEYDPNNSFFKSDENNYYKDGLGFLDEADNKKPLIMAPSMSYQITEVTRESQEEELMKEPSHSNQMTEVAPESQEASEQVKPNELISKYKNRCNKESSKYCYSRRFKFDFRIPLKYRSLDSIAFFDTDLRGGTYGVKSLLIISPRGERKNYQLSSCEQKTPIELNDSNIELNFSCFFDITAFYQNSTFRIYHKISSVNSDDSNQENYLPLRHFEGIYTIVFELGSLLKRVELDADDNNAYSDGLKNPDEELKLISKEGEITEGEITEGEKNFQPLILTELTEDVKNINLEVLQLGLTGNFKFANILTRENTIGRTVSFGGTICLKDSLKSHQLEHTSFRVILESTRDNYFTTEESDDGESRVVLQTGGDNTGNKPKVVEIFPDETESTRFKTNAESCLTIPIFIEHKIFNRQKYFEVIAHVISKELNLYGKVKLALNPWQRAFQAFQDAQNLDDRDIRFDVEGIPEPELVINQFRSINLFPSYGLDKLLNIHLFHRLYLLFQPFIRRPDNVSLGLDHKSRELLRDGYYLVRVLILRNPKETGAWHAVYNQDNLDENRTKIELEGDVIDLRRSDYITHTDSVVRTKANFVNFYMPLHIATKQLYYVASRNIIVVQIYPADPASIYYKDKNKTQIDTEETKWKAFTNHELQNEAYGGAINIQNWTNWNLLQPVEIDTDKMIELSPIGKKYKHFNFRNQEEQENSLKENKKQDEDKTTDSGLQNEVLTEGTGASPKLTDQVEVSYKDVTERAENNEEGLLEECKQALTLFNLNSSDGTTIVSSLEKIDSISKELEDILDSISKEKNENTLKDLNEKAMTRKQESEKLKAEVANQINLLLEENEYPKNREEETKNCFDKYLLREEDLSPALEIYKELTESKYTKSLKEYFSLENALKPIELGTEESGAFIEDLKKSYEKYLNETGIKDFNIRTKDYSLLFNYYYNFFKVFNYKKMGNNRLSKPEGFHLSFNDSLKLGNVSAGHLIDSYMLMLTEYSKDKDFLAAIFNFIEENQEILDSNIDLSKEPDCASLELLEEILSCQSKKLKFLESSNIFETLKFTKDMSSDVFVKKQTLLFMILFILPKEDISFLDNQNLNPYFGLSSNPSKFLESKSESYLKKINESLRENHDNIIEKYNYILNTVSIKDNAEQEMNDFFAEGKERLFIKHLGIEGYLNENELKALVNKGLKKKDFKNYENIPFLRSLCHFWFEDFMKGYLDSKLRLSTYTNYMRQFNYLQALEHAYVENNLNHDEFNKDIQFVIDQTENTIMGEAEKKCHREYRQCVSEDFCSGGFLNKNNKEDSKNQYCQDISFDNNSCSHWVKENVCEKHPDLVLCDQDIVTCEKINSFCRFNPDKSFCSDFENRCFKKYTTCLEKSQVNPQLFQRDLDQFLNNTKSAIKTCTRDFNEFFKVENKMIVYDISHNDSDLNYEGGFLKNFSYTHNNSVGSYMNWTAQRGRSVSVKAGGSAKFSILQSFFENILKFLSISFTISGDITQSQSSNESNSARNAWDARAGDGIYLSVGKAEVEIGVKEFQKCLVIKPRPNSFRASFKTGKPDYYKNLWSDQVTDLDKIVFSRPGLILCNPVEKRDENDLEKINESYYYISQANMDPGNSQFLDLYDLANRPFISIIRGNREFLKFYHVARLIKLGKDENRPQDYEFQDEDFYFGRYLKKDTITKPPYNQFVNYGDIVDHAIFLSLELRTQTGFYPGIYDYPYDIEEEIDASYLNGEETYIQEILNPFDIFEVPNYGGNGKATPINNR